MLNWWNRMPVVTLCSGRAFSVLSLFDGDPARMSFSLFLVFMFWPDQSKRKNRDPVVHYFPFFCHADGGRNNVNKEKPAVCWWQKERKGRQDHGRISFFLFVFFAGIIKKGEEKERNDARMKKTIRKKDAGRPFLFFSLHRWPHQVYWPTVMKRKWKGKEHRILSTGRRHVLLWPASKLKTCAVG